VVTSLRVLTWNVKFLPAAVKLAIAPALKPRGWWESGAKRVLDEQRVEEVAAAIVASDHDLVLLQEVLHEPARDVLAKRLGDAGYYVVAKVDSGDLFNDDSGLFVASKLPVLWHRFEEFQNKRMPDSLIDKGVLALRLDASAYFGNAAPALFAFVTHMQSDADRSPTRLLQQRQLQRFLTNVLTPVKQKDTTAAILLGDFNVVAERAVSTGGYVITPEYAALSTLLDFPRDLYRELHMDPGFTWDGTINAAMTRRNDRVRSRIDYAFALDWVPQHGEDREPPALARLTNEHAEVLPFVHEERHLSDHFGVSVTLSI